MSSCDDRISAALVEEHGLTSGMVEEAIMVIPEKHWGTGEILYLQPARILLHIVEVTDFYTQDMGGGYLWEKRFTFQPEVMKITADQLPCQPALLEYYQAVEKRYCDWLKDLTVESLLAKEPHFTWAGSTILGRIIYEQAHSRQHLGELNAELRRRDLPRIKWRTLKR